ncbi:MAG: glycosyltransferase family 2 protein [Lachnospiraceae bacterium]
MNQNRVEKPLVSVVLPVYNGERYLESSIESCLNQTYRNLELLILDDGSTDRSAEIAKHYEKLDSRVHYHKNPQNLKLPRTLNRGFALAAGDYLTWTSDDNYYRPQALEKMVAELEKGNSEFVFAACSIIDEEGMEHSTISAPEEYRSAIWNWNFVGACFMYSRKAYETIGDYDPELFLCEDYDYWLRMFSRFEISYLDENLYAYRRHGKALSATNREGQFDAFEKVLKKNFREKKNATTLDRFYLYRGLHHSRSLQKSFKEKNKYLLKLMCYKVWHKIIYRFCQE